MEILPKILLALSLVVAVPLVIVTFTHAPKQSHLDSSSVRDRKPYLSCKSQICYLQEPHRVKDK